MKKFAVLFLITILTVATMSDAFAGINYAFTAQTEETEQSEELPKEDTSEELLSEDNAEEPFYDAVETDNMTVTLEAEEGVLPSDATFYAEEATDDIKEVQKAVKKELEDNERVAASYVLDLKTLDEQEQEVQPEGEVVLTFENELFRNKNLTAKIFHITEDEDGLKAELLDGDINKSTMTVISDGFSYYTVEFTYNNLQYVMEGDTEIKLSEILEYVGLEGEVSEVYGSDDSLFSFEYKNDEWYVKANRAFTSDEWMKVVIDGIEYEIVVTDDTLIYLVSEGATTHGTPTLTHHSYKSTTGQTVTLNGQTYTIYPTFHYYYKPSAEGGGLVTTSSNPITVPQKEGKVFAGYYTEPNGGGTLTITPGGYLNDSNSSFSGTYNSENGRYELYAKWDGGITLTADANGGTIPATEGWTVSGTTATKTMLEGAEYGTLPTPTRAGYIFTGWYTASSGGTEVTSSTIIDSTDTTIYAHWAISYTLTADANGGLINGAKGWTVASNYLTATKKIASADAYNKLPTPTKTGYTFTGWYTAAFGGTEVTKTTVMGEQNTTIYAHWESTALSSNGTAYAMLTSSGQLIFFRSTSSYSNGSSTTVTDIKGNTYTGTVYTNIETTNLTSTANCRWYSNRAKVKSVQVASGQTIKPVNMCNWFYGHTALVTADLTGFDLSGVTSMAYTFNGCTVLKTVNLGTSANTALTDTSRMFNGDSALTTIYATDNWTNSQITTSTRMFYQCSNKLKGGNGTTWSSSYVDKTRARIDKTGQAGYFTLAQSSGKYRNVDWRIEAIEGSEHNVLVIGKAGETQTYDYEDPSVADDYDGVPPWPWLDFEVGSVRVEGTVNGNGSHAGMFYGLTADGEIDLWNFKTSNVTSMVCMFGAMEYVESIELSGFDTSSVTDMGEMFSGYGGSRGDIIELDLSSFDTSNVTNMSDMFYNAQNISTIYVSETWDVSGVTTSSNMFYQTYELCGGNGTEYSSSYKDKTYAVIDTVSTPGYLTYKAYARETPCAVLKGNGELVFFIASQTYANDTTGTFEDIDGNTYTGRIFTGFTDGSIPWESYKANITEVNVAQEMTPSSINRWFKDCENLQEAHLANMVAPGSMVSAFANCESLETLDIRSFETVSNMKSMIYGLTSLKNICLGENWTFNSDAADEPPAFEIVSWASGTEAQIAAMLEAHYNDEIDITDYWSVGDTRTVTLNGETQELVLMNEGGKTLTTPINGHTECAFIVGLKDCMNDGMAMNSTATNSGSWEGSAMRTHCNGTFRNYFSATMKSIFKQHKNITASSSSQNQTTDDYFALPAEKEVYGYLLGTEYDAYSIANEQSALSQFEWYSNYEDGSLSEWHAFKTWYYYEDDKDDNVGVYWLRSPCMGSNKSFCFFNGYNNGQPGASNANAEAGYSPFGVI